MKTKILFIGPRRFAPHVGLKNTKIIYPTLFEPLKGCEFHLLHGKPELPEYTKELTKKYGLIFHRVKGRKIRDWINETVRIVNNYEIDVLTNLFLGYYYGFIVAKAAFATHQKSVVRFAANEIRVRKYAGCYTGLRGKARYVKEKYMERVAIKLAHDVIAMSPWEEERLKRISPSPGKVKWCMRGVDISKYRPSSRKEKRRAQKFLFIGRKVKEKGYKLIESVAYELENEYPDIQFYFAGTFDIEKKGNRNFIGYYPPEKIRELYSEMDAVILPSQSEGFPNVVTEAMAMGLPCIISQSYHNGFFTHKENIMLTEFTQKDLKKNILALYKEEQLSRQIGVRSRELAVEVFDHKKWGEKYRSIILNGLTYE